MSTPMSILLAVAATFGAPAGDLDYDEVFCLAQNIYFEASIEHRDGKSAVAHVTFSWTHDGKSDRIPLYDGRRIERPWAFDAWIESVEVAIEAMTGQSQDPTGGADFYYAHRLVTPYWSHGFTVAAVIGNHTFMRDPEDS